MRTAVKPLAGLVRRVKNQFVLPPPVYAVEPFEEVFTARCMSQLTGVPYCFAGPPKGQPCVAVLGYAMPVRAFALLIAEVMHNARFSYQVDLIDKLNTEIKFINQGLPDPWQQTDGFEIARSMISRMWTALVANDGIEGAIGAIRQFDVDYALLLADPPPP